MDKTWFFIFKIFFSISSRLKKKQTIYFKKIIERKCKNFTPPLKVNGVSKINDNTFLGKNVNFNGMHIGGKGKVEIGDNFHSGTNCQIITSNHNFDYGIKVPYDHTYIHKDVLIEDNVWIGNNVIILGGVTIGEGAIVQAGSVVVKSIEKYGIAGGHPAKVFSYRNKDHYENIKKQKKFH